MANVPLDVEIDFAKIVAAENWKGVVDPNSIEVFDTTSHAPVASARTEDFAYSDRGHLQWVIENPERRDYEIRFNTVRERPPLLPQEHTPLIGVGDLLRYNAGEPRPIAPIYLSGLLDLNGDGLRDLIDNPVQGQFANHHMFGQGIGGHRAHGSHQPQSDRQIIVGAFLGQIGGG